MTHREALRKFFGFESFLDAQEEVIADVMNGNDLCVVMPTGSGKSLCYQLPTLMRPGYGLIVSPLIALMRDQVEALRARGVDAACINSAVAPDEQQRGLDAIAAGRAKMLYVAPERFRAPRFRDFIQHHPPAMLVVDEAHCISQWGHDFRPDYLRMGEFVAGAGITQVCAFTATATPAVRNDIGRHLGRPDMALHVAGFQRPNLAFAVVHCAGRKQKAETVERLLKDAKPTIIYTSTRKDVDALVETFGCLGYHAGMNDAERTRVQQAFMADPCPVLAATSAFGMGIDRPDVRRVIHYQTPGSLEAYYQEAGRAGRDGADAECILLHAYQDRYIQEFLVDVNNPPAAVIDRLHGALVKRTEDKDRDVVTVAVSALLAEIPDAAERHLDSALRVMEKLGLVERLRTEPDAGLLTFPGDAAALEAEHSHQGTQRSRLIFRVVRQMGATSGTGGVFNIRQLAAISGLRPEQVLHVLSALQGDVLTWTPAPAVRTLRVLDQRRPIQIDTAEIERKRELDLARIDDVFNYTRARTCRQNHLVTYFGQKVGAWRCERCDVCRPDAAPGRRRPDDAEMETLKTVLRTIADLDGRFGRRRIAQILAGSNADDLLARRLDRDDNYGALAAVSEPQILRSIDALMREGSVARTELSEYPCVTITPHGRDVLAGREIPLVDLPPPSGRSRRTPATATRRRRGGDDDAPPAPGSATTVDPALFDCLRSIRAELAEARNVEPYRILSNAALEGLCLRQPRTPDEALEVKGVGPVKARTVVPRFIDAIQEWAAR